MRLRGGCLCCLRLTIPCLTGQVLADVVQCKGATAGTLDGWGWRTSSRICVFPGMMGWPVFLPRLRILVFGLMGWLGCLYHRDTQD